MTRGIDAVKRGRSRSRAGRRSGRAAPTGTGAEGAGPTGAPGRRARALAVLILVLPVAFAGDCGDDDPLFPEFREIAGVYDATSVVFLAEADTRISEDLIARGSDLTLVIEEDGDFRSAFRTPQGGILRSEGEVEVLDGRLAFDADPFILDDGVAPRVFDFALAGDRLLLFADEAAFDFDGDGAREPALLEIDLLRL